MKITFLLKSEWLLQECILYYIVRTTGWGQPSPSFVDEFEEAKAWNFEVESVCSIFR